jgi:hypothetical protein
MVTLFPAFIITYIKSKIDRQQKLPEKWRYAFASYFNL